MVDEETRNKGRSLTDTQREYLTGEGENISDNYERQIRSKIRDRFVGSIQDLGIIAKNLQQKDRKNLYNYNTDKSLNEVLGEVTTFPESQYGRGDFLFTVVFGELIQFYWKTLRENGATREELLRRFELLAERAEHEYRNEFERYEGWLEQGKRPTDIEADFRMESVDDVDIDALLTRLEEDADSGYRSVSELSGLEMKALIESGDAEISLTE